MAAKAFASRVQNARLKLLCLPVAIQTETKFRVLFAHLHRVVYHAAVEFRKLRLKIRITDIQMFMRDKVNRPLLAGRRVCAKL
jgi:hypothetical protein